MNRDACAAGACLLRCQHAAVDEQLAQLDMSRLQAAATGWRRQQRGDECALPPALPEQMDVAPELQRQLACCGNLLHVVGDEEERIRAALLLQMRDAASREDRELFAVVPERQQLRVRRVRRCNCGVNVSVLADLYLPPMLEAMMRW